VGIKEGLAYNSSTVLDTISRAEFFTIALS